VLDERLRAAWRARERAVPISPVLSLEPEGLDGAGVLFPAIFKRYRGSLRDSVCFVRGPAARRTGAYFFILRAPPSNVVTIACIYPSWVM
jgi:hypothetical protein